MSISFTQFLNVYLVAFPDNVTDPQLSRWYTDMNRQVRYNNEKRGVQEVALDSGRSYQLAIAGLAQADWFAIVVRCVGKGVVTLAAKDASSVDIASSTPVYGTAILPGILMLSTYNLTAAPTITSQADGSVFEIFGATCVEDGG